MDVHHGGITRSQDASILQEVQHVDLALELLHGVHLKVLMTDDIATHQLRNMHLPSEHVGVGNALKLHIDVLTGLGGQHFLLVDGDGHHFSLAAVRHQQHTITHDLAVKLPPNSYQSTRLDLTSDGAAAVVVLLENRQTERSGGIAVAHIHAIQDLEERRSAVPRTDALRNAVLQVIALQAGERKEGHISLHVVTHSLEVRRETGDDLIVTLFRPLDGLFIHLVDGDDQLLHTQSTMKECND